MDPVKLGRGVWRIIFELLNFHDQIQFRAISRYFLQYNIVNIPFYYVLTRNDFSLFPHIDLKCIMNKKKEINRTVSNLCTLKPLAIRI